MLSCCAGVINTRTARFLFSRGYPLPQHPLSIAGKGGAAIRSPARSRENQYTLSRSFLYPGSTNQKPTLPTLVPV